MPDAEVRRQRAAFRRGVVRAATIAAVLVAAFAFLALHALDQSRLAKQATSRAETGELKAHQNLYAADMNMASQALQEGNLGLVRTLLEAHRPKAGERDLRGFEWRYLWQESQGDQLKVLGGHEDIVTCVAFSPDGATLATGSRDRSIILWDVARQAKMESISGHSNHVVSVAFSPNGQILASASVDGLVRLWDLKTRTVINTLRTSPARVAFSPAGNLLAIGIGSPVFADGGGGVKLWDYSTGSVQTFSDCGSRVAFSPDGKILATGSRQRRIKLWEIATSRQIRSLEDSGDVLCLTFSPDGRYVAAGAWTGETQLWEASTGRLLAPFPGHGVEVWAMQFSPDGHLLATGASDQTLRLFEVVSRKEVARLKGHGSEIWALAFSPDGKLLASGGKDHAVMLWSSIPRPEIPNLIIKSWEDGGFWERPAFSPDGKTLAARSDVGQITLWDVSRRQALAAFPRGRFTLAFASGGKMLVTLSTNDAVEIWDAVTHTLLNEVTLARLRTGHRPPALSPNGQVLATGRGVQISWWDTRTGQPLGDLSGNRSGIQDLEFSPDGGILASASVDGTVKLWDAATHQELATLRGHDDVVDAVAFSPDGKTLASSSYDDTVKLWDVVTRRNLGTIRGQQGCNGVAFSPDGKTLAFGDGSGKIRLINLATLRPVGILQHAPANALVLFSPDGYTLASVNVVGQIQMWRAPSFAETDGQLKIKN